MRVSPSVVIGFVLAWAAAWTPAQAFKPKDVPVNNTSGATTVTGATIVLTPNGSSGKIFISGQKSKVYKGGPIPGITTANIFTEEKNHTLTNLGTVTVDTGATLSLTITKDASNRTVVLGPGSNFTAGGTLSLGTGSAITLNSTLSDANGITINSGAIFTAAGATLLNSGVTFTGVTNSTVSSSGILQIGSGSVVTTAANTLTLGTNSTINGGLLTFGTDGAIGATVDLIKAGTGSTILSPNDFTLNSGTITNVPISGGLIISNTAGNLNLNGATLTVGQNTNLTSTVTLNGSLGGLNLNTTGLVTLNATGFTGSNFLTSTDRLGFTAPATITIISASTLTNRTLTIPVSTTLTVNMPPGTPLKSIPSIQLATTDASATPTKTSFLDGLNTNGGSVSILYLPAVQNLFSNPVSIHLSELETPGVQEKFVLQMSYDAVAASSLGSLLNLYLAWFDPADGTWKNAVDGNSDGGLGAQPVAGAYDPTADFNLGWYGVDTANSTVWAVVDHDGEFGVGALAPVTHTTLAAHSMSFQVADVPEPSTAALLVCGLALFGRRSRRQ